MQTTNVAIALLSCVSLLLVGANRENTPPQSDEIAIENLNIDQEVTLIWLGGGDYPGKLPANGVTITDDICIWLMA